MSFKNLMLAAIALAAFSACTPKSDSSNGSANVSPAVSPADTEDGSTGSDYQRGTSAYDLTIESRDMSVDGATADRSDSTLFTDYPALAHHVAELEAVTRAVETNEGHLELFANDEMILAIKLDQTNPTVAWSRAGDFRPEHVMYTRAAEDQKLATASLSIDMKECRAEEQQQQQDQEQEQEKGQDQDKGQDQSADKGQDQIADKGQDQDQDKGEDKGQDKAPTEICKTVTYVVNFREVVQEKSQDQEKGQEKGQDKGQDQSADKGQSQDKGQDQVGGGSGSDSGSGDQAGDDSGADRGSDDQAGNDSGTGTGDTGAGSDAGTGGI